MQLVSVLPVPAKIPRPPFTLEVQFASVLAFWAKIPSPVLLDDVQLLNDESKARMPAVVPVL